MALIGGISKPYSSIEKSMSQAPSMPMYWDAYLADTTHLTTEEHGAYMLLLAAMWRRNGWVPDDDKDNARILGLSLAKWKRTKPRLFPFLIFENNNISQKKLQKTWQKTQEKIQINAKNGALGGRAKSNKNKDLSQANATISLKRKATIPEPEPEPYNKTPANAGIKKVVNNDFDVFWKAYPHKVGKGDARKKFEIIQKTNKVSFKKLLDGLSAYINSKPADRSWCNPATWLHQERWLDEPVEVSNAHAPRKTLAERNRESFERQKAEIMGYDNSSTFAKEQLTIDGKVN